MAENNLQALIESLEPLARSICDALQAELVKMGFCAPVASVAPHTDAEYRLERDPASGQDSLVGVWRNDRGEKCGELLFHADGSFFAEYDVIHVHPQQARWFVEAVTAWGRGDVIKAEPRLLPMVS